MSEKSQEKPKIYPAEFRESSVKLAIESDQPIAQTAREPGINPNTLYGWISKYSKPGSSPDVVSRTDQHLYDGLKQLKKENARLKEERDILKKPPSRLSSSLWKETVFRYSGVNAQTLAARFLEALVPVKKPGRWEAADPTLVAPRVTPFGKVN